MQETKEEIKCIVESIYDMKLLNSIKTVILVAKESKEKRR